MKAFKFVVPGDQHYPLRSDPRLQYRGCLAVAVAEDEASARARVEAYAQEFGFDARWLEIARVTEVSLANPTTLAFVMI